MIKRALWLASVLAAVGSGAQAQDTLSRAKTSAEAKAAVKPIPKGGK